MFRINFLALSFFLALCPLAWGGYQSEVYGSIGRSSTDSEQHHKDQEVDFYQGAYSYFFQPVEAYSDLPAESTFFSRSSAIVFGVERSEQVPKDDFLKTRLVYDWSNAEVNHRLRIGFAYAQHKSEPGNRHMNGGLAGVSVYFLDTAKADIDTSYLEQLMEEEVSDVYSFPLLSSDFCKRVQTYVRTIWREIELHNDEVELAAAKAVTASISSSISRQIVLT